MTCVVVPATYISKNVCKASTIFGFISSSQLSSRTSIKSSCFQSFCFIHSFFTKAYSCTRGGTSTWLRICSTCSDCLLLCWNAHYSQHHKQMPANLQRVQRKCSAKCVGLAYSAFHQASRQTSSACTMANRVKYGKHGKTAQGVRHVISGCNMPRLGNDTATT